MDEVYTNREEPTIEIKMNYDVEGLFHLWMGIANYQSYRVNDPDPDIEPMPGNHPLIRIQHTIHSMLDVLIAEGVREGNYIAPLLELKRILAQPATENGNG